MFFQGRLKDGHCITEMSWAHSWVELYLRMLWVIWYHPAEAGFSKTKACSDPELDDPAVQAWEVCDDDWRVGKLMQVGVCFFLQHGRSWKEHLSVIWSPPPLDHVQKSLLFRGSLLCFSVCPLLQCCHWTPLERAWFHPLCTVHWVFIYIDEILPEPSLLCIVLPGVVEVCYEDMAWDLKAEFRHRYWQCPPDCVEQVYIHLLFLSTVALPELSTIRMKTSGRIAATLLLSVAPVIYYTLFGGGFCLFVCFSLCRRDEEDRNFITIFSFYITLQYLHPSNFSSCEYLKKELYLGFVC